VIENDSLQKLESWKKAANAAPVTSFWLYPGIRETTMHARNTTLAGASFPFI
jgi:hypothetical protein